MLYLAYGSNLNRTQMRRRAPDARPMGSIILKDAKLVFRGVADVVYAAGLDMPVGVWRISRNDERALDSFEGAGRVYRKELVELDNGQEALLYTMTNTTGIYPPSQYYYDLVRTGYEQWSMDHGYLQNALAEALADKHKDEQVLARRARQKASVLQRRIAKLA